MRYFAQPFGQRRAQLGCLRFTNARDDLVQVYLVADIFFGSEHQGGNV